MKVELWGWSLPVAWGRVQNYEGEWAWFILTRHSDVDTFEFRLEKYKAEPLNKDILDAAQFLRHSKIPNVPEIQPAYFEGPDFFASYEEALKDLERAFSPTRERVPEWISPECETWSHWAWVFKPDPLGRWTDPIPSEAGGEMRVQCFGPGNFTYYGSFTTDGQYLARQDLVDLFPEEVRDAFNADRETWLASREAEKQAREAAKIRTAKNLLGMP